MASTQQSAREFLQNGRTLLITGHLNCDHIIEALNKCKLFMNHELNSAKSSEDNQDKIRIILDMVISMGEEACYVFLKILDKKRFQVFPRPGLGYRDLHHWISCFSFRDEPQSHTASKTDSDPCTKYQHLLRWKAKQIQDEKWNQSMNFLKKEQKMKPFMYIPLVMDTDYGTVSKQKKNKGSKKSRSKKLKTYIPTDKKVLSPKDLLMNDEKNILLVGKPGVGKTTVALEILRLWTEEKSPESYMFYFDEPLMRVFSQTSYPQTLKDLLFEKYLSPQEEADHVLENIQRNSENVVLIFDGVMDVTENSVIRQLMEKKLLKDAKVLTTCRPEAEDTGYLSNWQSYRVEVQGFNHQSICEYFKWMLGTTDDMGALENPELFSLCSVPLYAFIVTACISAIPTKERYKPLTVTEMYVHIFRFCMKQHGNQNVEYLDKYIADNKRDIVNLAQASYQAMQARTVNLSDLDNEDKFVQNAFLTRPLRNPSTTSCNMFAFLHNTMQEFWAALYLTLNPDCITSVLDQCRSDEDGKYLKYIIPFLIGLLSDNLVQLIKCLVPVKQIQATRAKYFQPIIDTFLYTQEQNEEGDNEQYVEADNILFVCRCLYEYQSPDACLVFLEKLQYEIDLEDQTLDPHQCCVVSYVVNQARHQSINLNLMECNITDPGLKLLLGSLKNLKFLRSTNILQPQIWRVALEAEQFSDFESLLNLFSFELHLDVYERLNQKVFQRMTEVLKKKRSDSVHLCLHVKEELITASLQMAIFESLANIATIRVFPNKFQVSVEAKLYLQGAVHEMETGQRCVRNLLSICSKNRRENFEELCRILLKLHEDGKKLGVSPFLQPVFYALPPTWLVHPSTPSLSLLLQTIKALNLKKPAELDHATYMMNELKLILQCIPYITEIRFSAALRQSNDIHKIVKTVADLFILASECGEKELWSLSTVCSYSNFPFSKDSKTLQSIFFLDLFSQLKESSLWKTALQALKPILNVAPAVWTVDLPKLEKTSVLIEVLKLQATRKPLELITCSCEREKLRAFLNCSHYISEFRCDEQFFQTVCEVLSTDTEWNPKQIAELLRVLGFSIYLIDMLPNRLCKAVGSVFELLENNDISISLLPQKISNQGCAYLFSNLRKFQTLRVNEIAVSKLAQLIRSGKVTQSVTVAELSVVLSDSHLPERELCRLVSYLTFLLRIWTVHNLNLEFKIKPQLLICLLSHQGAFSIRFHEDTLQQLAEVVYDSQDENLTQLFLEKMDGDLSACSLSWDVLSYLIQVSKQQVTLDLPEGRFNVQNIPRLLLVLDTVCFKRISPRFVRAALNQIYQERAGHLIVKLVKTSANLINFSMRELDSADCKALCFALHYSDGVKLNLMNSVIPQNEIDSIVKLMHRVSELRIDRKLLLSFLHASKDVKKQAHALLIALNHKLDFSCSSSLGSGRFAQEKRDHLSLSHMDFTSISFAIESSTLDIELILCDCQAGDSALEALLPILHKVHLHMDKSLLCQLLTLISTASNAMSLKWASSLSKALGKELDLSETPLDYQTCKALELILDNSDGFTHLNLSHCQITDACLDLLLPQLHKILTLDLTGNYITDKGVERLCMSLDVNSFTKSICLCDNHITESGFLVKEARLETQPPRCSQPQDLGSKSKMRKAMTGFVKSQMEDPIKEIEPETRHK
ncbi:uncharacterized protein LOC130231871 isoform X2 [Danio aesculapii]|uniref:uncharacterized protein LOC130231871 isoform X2 n=1 Tax=Danio aesculapii TaxID=1142201 RepID=UPI0024BF46C4|nr:uncharacterized protein LOC130231871 isoform X2 [Danio aesculapii]